MKHARFLPFSVLMLVVLFGFQSLQAQARQTYVFTGSETQGQFGVAVAGAGDIDNDGMADLVVGAYAYSSPSAASGYANVFSGRDGSLLYHLRAGIAGDAFGASVAGAGDVNNDGFDDVIIGTFYTVFSSDPGRAYVYSGQDGSLLYALAGSGGGDNFGFDVAGVGDVDKDGFADVIVGAFTNDAAGGDAGRAYVYSGQHGSLLFTLTPPPGNLYFGQSVAGGGDANNDGFLDFVVGAEGHVFVYSGRDASLLKTFVGNSSDNFGRNVSFVGDLDADGCDEVLVGADRDDAGGADAGKVYIFSGFDGTVLRVLVGPSAGEHFGFDFDGLGDINGDSCSDLVVGAHRGTLGKAYLISGRDGVVLYGLTGESSGDYFGYAVGDAGDINGNGRSAVIVGAAYNNEGGTFAGRAYVYSFGPFTGIISGAVSSSGDGVQDVEVRLLDENDEPLEAFPPVWTDISGEYSFIDVLEGTYHILILEPPGYAADQNPKSATVTSGGTATVDFQLVRLKGTVAGTVLANGAGLRGIPVTLLNTDGLPAPGFEPQLTDAIGHYQFDEVPTDDYQVMIVEPLGYAADQNPKAVTVAAIATSVVDFTLSWTVLSDVAEKWSYWKNQFDKVLKGKRTDETPENLTSYIVTIQQHYTPHFDLYAFMSFDEWQEVLSKPTHPTKRDEALAEVAALVLNFGSLKLGQYMVITEDGRTAGDVLTYVSSVIANPMSTDQELEDAKKLAAKANHGDNQKIMAGEVPAGSVLYKGGQQSIEWGFGTPTVYALEQNYPNPFNPTTTIQYDLPKAGYVTLKVYDYLGKEVATLTSGEKQPGRYTTPVQCSESCQWCLHLQTPVRGVCTSSQVHPLEVIWTCSIREQEGPGSMSGESIRHGIWFLPK